MTMMANPIPTGMDPEFFSDDLWRPVHGHFDAPGYEISRDAEVISPRGAKLNPQVTGNYHWVGMRMSTGKARTVRLDRVMLYTFVGPPFDPAAQPAHIDGNGGNCRADNLKWSIDTNETKVSTPAVAKGSRLVRAARKPAVVQPKKKTPPPSPVEVYQVYSLDGMDVTVDSARNLTVPAEVLSPAELQTFVKIAQQVIEMNKMMGF